MAGRQAPRTSSPRLVVWAILMFLVGLGIGSILTQQSCSKKKRLPGEEEQTAPRPAPKHPGRRAPAPGVVPAPSEPPAEKAPKGVPHPEAPEPVPAPVPVPKAAQPPAGLPRLALVIDDLGYMPPELVTRLCAQSVAFSVAVLPYQEYSKASADIAYGRGKEVMLHLPMEPKGYPAPGKDPGPDAVMYDLPEAVIRDRVRKALADIPHRQGVNNHMGSRVTPDRARMTWVLQEIKAKHCFFVDSRTEKDSVAFQVAQELGVPSVQRKVFLDDDKSFEAMSRQWAQALALAQKDGQVLIIGHIYRETVEALEKLVPASKGKVAFVKASALVH